VIKTGLVKYLTEVTFCIKIYKFYFTGNIGRKNMKMNRVTKADREAEIEKDRQDNI